MSGIVSRHDKDWIVYSHGGTKNTNIESKNLKYLNIFNKLINLLIQERRILKETSIKKIPNIKSKKLKTKLIKIFSRKSKLIIENKSIII